MTLSQNFALMLLAVSAIVAVGLLGRRDMWRFICLYWILLAIRNAIDFFGGLR